MRFIASRLLIRKHLLPIELDSHPLLGALVFQDWGMDARLVVKIKQRRRGQMAEIQVWRGALGYFLSDSILSHSRA